MIIMNYKIKRLRRYLKKQKLLGHNFREIKFYLLVNKKHYNDYEIRQAMK